MVDIQSHFVGNALVTNARGHVKTPLEIIVSCHTDRGYGKLLGIEYTKFQTHGDGIIHCTFRQKFAFKTFDMNFVKRIKTTCNGVDIKFKTVESLVDLQGKWSVRSTLGGGSDVYLSQKTNIPTWALFPGVKNVVKNLMTHRIQGIYKQLEIVCLLI